MTDQHPADTATSEAVHDGLPVSGYRPQSAAAVDLVNANKQLEELILRTLDTLQEMAKLEGGPDGRWLAIGRTQIEQGFMAVNRAIFKPGRVELPYPFTPDDALAPLRDVRPAVD